MTDESVAARAPSGTHDVLWPESTRWEALLVAFADQVERAGYGLAHTPIFEDVKVFRRGIGEGSDVVGKEMYEFEDRGGRALALRPEGTAPLVRAYRPAPPSAPVEGLVRHARPSGTSGRRPAGTASTTSWASRRSGPRTPTSTSRWSGWPTRSSGRSAWPRSSSGINSMGDAVCRPAYLEPLRTYLDERQDQLCPEHRERLDANPLRVLDCKRAECREATASAPRLVDHLCEPCRLHFDRVQAGPGRPRGALRPRPPAGPGIRLLHPDDLRVLLRAPSSRRRTASGAAVATTDWSRCSAGRRRRASGSASASNGSCWPVTPKGCSRWPPKPAHAFVVDVTGGEAARDITA